MNQSKKTFLFLFLWLLISTNINSEIIKTDINFLNKKDKEIFLEKCSDSESYIVNSSCVNFLGIKLFMYTFNNNNVLKDDLSKIQNKAISYLQVASKKGYKKAFINLGWIYSLEQTSFYNLQKSAYFFKKAYMKEINYKKTKPNLIYKEKKLKKYEHIELAISLMMKLDLYNSYYKNEKYNYISKQEFINANILFKKIIKKTKISNSDLESIKVKVSNENKIILNLLSLDLNSYKTKYKLDAEEKVKRLAFIYKNLP